MKKIINIVVLIFSLSVLFAQVPAAGQRKDKIEAMRNAYITSQMNLTADEAQKFWPIYNEYHAEIVNLDNPVKNMGKPIDQLTEAEAKQLIYKELDLEAQKNTITKKYVERFLQVISAKKLILLRRAEREFKKIMIEQLKK